MARRGGLALAMALAALACATPALAVEGSEHDPFRRAVEEAGVTPPPPQRFSLPEGKLKITPSALLAAHPGQRLHFTVALSRSVPGATLVVRLPQRWVSVPASGIRATRAPTLARSARRRARVRRSGRTIQLTLERTAAGQTASFDIVDVGIPAGTYRLPFSWRDQHGRRTRAGRAKVSFYAPSREGPQVPKFARLSNPGFTTNASNDGIEESETFIAATEGNKDRIAVGSNWSNASMPAWITNDGGQTWTQRTLPQTIDKPGSTSSESGQICCDPTFAADSLGNIWFGGLSFTHGNVPGRIVVNRIAAGGTSFQSQTVGLKVPAGSNGDQDKPMMTIDNDSSSPTYGRLYFVWDAPIGSGIQIQISQCDTRVAGVSQAQRCDNADNWSTPVSVTSTTGSYIYADVAVGPDGRVYVVWWDYSNVNEIRGDVCDPSAQNCATAAAWSGAPAQHAIAVLDSTGSTPLPFACPILAQPGGRASTSSQVDVDHSGGANDDRVYVTWSDLRTGSGTTRCADGDPPLSTHLTFDSFVASAAGGALPGSANTSPNVGTRLITDGEGGGQSNSDDWFSWLAVDQTTGQAWADLYSTRDDSTRHKTNFYARSVTPSGGGHTLGTLTKVSTAQSDYSGNTCCSFGNDYGDYTGIAATGGVAYPVWTDNSGGDGDVFTFTGSPKPTATTNAATSITGTGATLNASINPKGSATTYHFEYGTSPGVYDHSTADKSAGSGSTSVNEPEPISGLATGTTYYFRVVATNGSGTTNGSERNFTTLARPAATTGAASSIGLTGATLNATVNPHGSATNYHFDYGTTPGGPYPNSTPTKSAGSGTSGVAEAEAISGLSSSTTYYFRVVATNTAGTTNGGELNFTTGTPIAPAVTTSAASNVSQTSATLNGSVNPKGSTTTYHFDYGTAPGVYDSSTPDKSAGSGTSSVSKFEDVSGLSSGTDYYYRLVADNVAGTTNGTEQHFKTTSAPVAPNATTDPATGIGQTSATLNSTINPKGDATSVHFEYGTASNKSAHSTPTKSAGSAASNLSVPQAIAGLAPSTTYYFHVVAQNGGGSTSGAERSFKTAAVPPPPKPPAVTTGGASLVSLTGATVTGTVNPMGQATSWRFQYGKTSGYGSSTASLPAGSGSTGQTVSSALQFLTPDTTYHYRLVATNGTGTSFGADQIFRTRLIDTTAPRFAISKKRVRLGAGRRLRVKVKCGAAEPESCNGMLRLYAGRRKIKVASAHFVIPPGKTARVRLKLSRRGARLLARNRSLRLLAVGRARDPAGNLGVKRVRFTLLPRRA